MKEANAVIADWNKLCRDTSVPWSVLKRMEPAIIGAVQCIEYLEQRIAELEAERDRYREDKE